MVVAIVSKGLAMNGGKRTDFSNELYTSQSRGMITPRSVGMKEWVSASISLISASCNEVQRDGYASREWVDQHDALAGWVSPGSEWPP